tara:strand:+ start:795 stop:1904 length:1110 start_codon:yes stop_codon:yes gene_type:complete
LKKYLEKKAICQPWHFNKKPENENYSFIIVIPSYREGSQIIPTLKSISKQIKINFSSILVIVVINNSANSPIEYFKDNQSTLNCIINSKYNFELVIVDAFYKNPLPRKKAGVGLARKIGFDLSLEYANQKTILISLDADTLIKENYLFILKSYFVKGIYHCIIPGIYHQKANNKNEENAIRNYEKFLYSTAENLVNSRSPYGFITMGSAMTFTKNCYIKAGGIPPKKATEDFYFLQEVVKTSSVISINEKLIFPSSRPSNRVYLGTGFRISQAINGQNLSNLYYSDESFHILKNWLKIGGNGFNNTMEEILSDAKVINPKLPEFLIKNKIKNIWKGLQNSCNNKDRFYHQFNCWFDGLKTHRLLKYFSN